MNLIRAGANIEAETKSGIKPLHLAARKGLVDVMEILLNAGAKVEELSPSAFKSVTSISGVDTTLLVLEAVKNNRLQVLEVFLNVGAPVNARDDAHRTLLHIAADNGCVAMVEMLLARGASINAKDNQGNTPLTIAKNRGYIEVIAILEDVCVTAGASRNIGLVPYLINSMGYSFVN